MLFKINDIIDVIVPNQTLYDIDIPMHYKDVPQQKVWKKFIIINVVNQDGEIYYDCVNYHNHSMFNSSKISRFNANYHMMRATICI